jgi:hypothetical protein
MTRRAMGLFVSLGVAVSACAAIAGLGDSPPTVATGGSDDAGARSEDSTQDAPAEDEPPTPADGDASGTIGSDDAGQDGDASAPEPEASAPDASGPDASGPDASGPDASGSDASVVNSTWCSTQEGAVLCADFDEPDAFALFTPNVSAGERAFTDQDTAYSPPSSLGSTLVTAAGAILAAQLRVNLPGSDAGTLVVSFELRMDPGCAIAPLNKVFLVTLTSDETTFRGLSAYNIGDGGFELRLGGFDSSGSFTNYLGIPFAAGAWVNVHYAYCPSNGSDGVTIGSSPVGCQVQPPGGIPLQALGVGLHSDSSELAFGCTILFDNMRVDEF